ncbi:MAG: hypothetical protein QM713_08155 [Arachnia sp.]
MPANDASDPLSRARYLPGGGDRFLGLWLNLTVEGRAAGKGADGRGARRVIDRFLREHATTIGTVGEDAFFDELRDASERYWTTCLDDTSYGTTMFGLKRLPKDELSGKMANDAASALAVIVNAKSKAQGAERLPRALIDGYLAALPHAHQDLRGALAKRPQTLAVVAHLLDPFA